MIGQLFHLILYQPLFNLLIVLYEYLPGHDFGMAIIFLTLFTRFISYPFSNQAIKAQKALNDIQPKLRQIQEKYKNDKTELARETMALYQREKISPFAGLLPLFIQLPILIALYQVFVRGLDPSSMVNLYKFITRPEIINPTFLNKIDLSKPSIILAILTGISQYFQTAMMSPQRNSQQEKNNKKIVEIKSQASEIMQKEIQYIFPLLIAFILFKTPSAVALYWLVSTLFSIVQQRLVKQNNRLYASAN